MFLASVSNDLRIYNTEDYNIAFHYENKDSNNYIVKHLEWSDDGKYVLQVTPFGRVDISCVTAQEGVRCLQCIPGDESRAAAFHKGGHRQIAVGCVLGKLYIWDTKFKRIIKTFTNAPSSIKFLDFNCKNTFLAAGLENGDTAIYGVTTNQQVGIINIPTQTHNNVSALKFHFDQRNILALASDEGCLLVRDLGTGKNKLFNSDAHKSIVSDISFSKVNEHVMFSCGYDKKMHCYDIRKEIVVATATTNHALTCIDVSTENYAALGNIKGQILIYDLRSIVKPVYILNDHSHSISKVCYQPEAGRRKRFLTLDASLKEIYSPKSHASPFTNFLVHNRTPEAVKSYEYIDQFNSPTYDMPLSPKREKLDHIDVSTDSFLVNIVGDQQETDPNRNTHVMSVDSPEENELTVSNMKSNRNNNIRKSISLGDKLSECGTSTSTPIVSGKVNMNVASHSPIFSNGIIDTKQAEGDHSTDNEDSVKRNTPIIPICPLKKADSVDTVESAIETVKCTPNSMLDLGNELKDFISYSIFDVLQQSKSNFMQITVQQTKNRLHLEDQIALLAQKVQDLQQNQNLLIEENKKLSIEVELLRSVRN